MQNQIEELQSHARDIPSKSLGAEAEAEAVVLKGIPFRTYIEINPSRL